jgi:plasmid stabilization system protein ParE
VRVRYTLPALADLNAILDYISESSPRGAERVKQRIQRVIGLLLSHPAMGASTDDPAIRRLSTPPYPYLVFYEIAEDEIVIHAVRHAARDSSTMPGSE